MRDHNKKLLLCSHLGKLALAVSLTLLLVNCNKTGITDTALPQIVSTDPAVNAEGIPLDATITVTFSEEMDTTTFNTTSFSLKLDSASVPGVVTFTPTSATFIPLDNLLSRNIYTVTLTTDITDAMGYTLPEMYEWRFSTISGDGQNIEITSMSPPDHSTGISVGTSATAVFSETMNPSTVNEETFVLREGTETVPGSVSLNDTTATFTPAINLQSGTTYTATVTTAAESESGGSLPENYSWSFTTAGPAGDDPPIDEPSDTTPPEAISTDPPDNADDVALNTLISVDFSEEMNSSTLNSSTFFLRQGFILVDGSVRASGSSATFAPEDNLLPGQTYRAVITTGVEDAAGNNLTEDVEWTFTTGIRDDEPPEIVETDPEEDDEDVSRDVTISVTFNEAMNPSTINSNTFLLLVDGPGNSEREVSGTIEYSDFTATFNPSEDLEEDEEYVAVITDEVEDMAGNELEESYRWEFKTEEEDDDDDDDD